jgi:DNA replication protein DnaC
MEAIIHHLSTFTTVYLTNAINTGNRSMDNACIAIVSICIIQTLHYVYTNWRKLYNCMIFHLYGMKDHPLDLWRAPYLHILQVDSDSFRKAYRPWYFDEKLSRMMYGGSYDTFLPLLKKNRLPPIKNHQGHNMMYDANSYTYTVDDNNGIYPIAIDLYGNCIYYNTRNGLGNILYKNFNGFNIREYIYKYLLEESERRGKIHDHTIFNVSSKNGMYDLKDVGNICEKKTFDTLFYTQKDELIRLLEKFKTNTLYPAHIPMDNKLGILLYGPPGTGKTGTISAIANYLERNLTVVNFSEISKCEDLDKALDPKRYKETIFVFDEFDCLLDVIANKKDKEDAKTDWGAALMAAEGDERKEILNMMRQGRQVASQSVNIAYLLQKLDGLESAEGRIIIATTNHPDKINPALLRPGRFDLKLCLGNCTQDMYGKILENYYRDERDVYKRVVKAGIQDYKYSPLEIMNLAMQQPSLAALLRVL